MQILEKLQKMYPDANIKRTTLGDFCSKLREELYEYTEAPLEKTAPQLGRNSMLLPYVDKIGDMLADSKPITVILTAIKADGYFGSYSLLQQYCLMIKLSVRISKKGSA